MKNTAIKAVFAVIMFCAVTRQSFGTVEATEPPPGGGVQCPEGNKYKCMEGNGLVIMKGDGDTPVTV